MAKILPMPKRMTKKLKHGHAMAERGKCKASKTYIAWNAMRSRCRNKKNDRYNDYGGRGITYDKRWDNFINFLLDMGEVTPGKTLDRKDNNGNYCKENCRWATQKEQSINKNCNRFVNVDGLNLTISQWAEKNNLNPQTITYRIDYRGARENEVKATEPAIGEARRE